MMAGPVQLSPETRAAIEASANNPVPWICRGCPKTLPSCGSTVEKCEHERYVANNSERLSQTMRYRGRLS